MGVVGSIRELDEDERESGMPLEPSDLPTLVEEYERALILASLAAADGHQRRAARMLGIGATTLSQKMKRLNLRGVALPPSALAPAGSGPEAGSPEEFRWRGRLPSGHGVEVRAVNGDILVEPGVGDEVEVVAQKRVQPNTPAGLSVEIVVSQSEQGLSIAAQYATHAAAGSSPASERLGPRRFPPPDDLRVNFRVRLPRGVSLDARTLNGDVEVHGLEGIIRAESARGTVMVSSLMPPQKS